MKKLSIRTRLAVVYVGLVLVAGTVLLGVTYVLMSSSLPHVKVTVDKSAGPPGSEAGAPAPGDESGRATGNLAGGETFSIGGTSVDPEGLPDALRSSALKSILIEGGSALVVVAGLTGVLAWFVTAQALQPLHRISETAERIGGAAESTGPGLHERIALDGPHDEVRRLADAFDVMLERLDRAFEGQRRFVANASHELRTPLAINRALVEVAVTRPDVSPDAQRLGESLLVVNRRHERLIDGLLTLADSENEVTEHQPVDLSDVAEHLVDLAHPAAADAAVRLRPVVAAAAPAAGDPVLLERLVQNLVENAVKHNVPGGWVEVRTGVSGAAAVVVVENSGPVVPRYELETIFQPFRRLAGERAAERPNRERGFGLGLSIVRAVARAHGGSVLATAREPEAGGGLVVTVTLPLAGSAAPVAARVPLPSERGAR
jgi:signal transduction histidine kinase